jgi:predicted RNA binding protein YcfA (HicA-like mRNA interferase family)
VRNLKVRDVLRILRKRGCVELRQRGSHRIWQCGKCKTTIPGSDGETIPTGTLKSIERDLTPCLGQAWLTNEP